MVEQLKKLTDLGFGVQFRSNEFGRTGKCSASLHKILEFNGIRLELRVHECGTSHEEALDSAAGKIKQECEKQLRICQEFFTVEI